jgi:hypothetical protein
MVWTIIRIDKETAIALKAKKLTSSESYDNILKRLLEIKAVEKVE